MDLSQNLNTLAVNVGNIFKTLDMLTVQGKEAHIFIDIKQQLAQINNGLVQLRDFSSRESVKQTASLQVPKEAYDEVSAGASCGETVCCENGECKETPKVLEN